MSRASRRADGTDPLPRSEGRNRGKGFGLLLLALGLCSGLALAQTPAITYVSAETLPIDSLTRQRQYATSVGAGFGNVLDTYLSPYSYTGINIRVHHEYTRWTRRFMQGDTARVSYHTYIALDGNILDNPAGNINEYSGALRYSMAWKYHFPALFLGKLHLSAGPMATFYAGGLYNEHDGNNPAQGRASLTIDATATAAMPLHLMQRPCLLSLSADVPLVGIAFSPNYGQSYYEIFSLGNYDHNVVFAHIGNMPSLRAQLLLHIPLNARATTSLRVGYVTEILQSTFNNLRYHSYSHTLMIGISKTLYRL